jgi:hypothetical protein
MGIKMKISWNILIIGLIFFMLFSSFSAGNDIENKFFSYSNNIDINLFFDKPKVSEFKINDQVYDRITIENIPNSISPDKPCLPVKPLRILIPNDSVIENIFITTSDEIILGNGFNIEIGGNIITFDNKIGEKNNLLFANRSYEENIISDTSLHKYRGFTIIHLNVYPIKYESITGKISFFENINLKIVIKKVNNQVSNSVNRGLEYDYDIIRDIVDNPNDLSYFYPIYDKEIQSKINYYYVIITNEELKNSNLEYNLQDLVDYKISKDYQATIVTLNEIVKNPDYRVFGKWGDANPSNPFFESEITGNLEYFDDTPARIRNFIRYIYSEWNTKYVLLVGDADVIKPEDNIIPLRGLFANESGLPLISNPPEEEEDDIPSDVYYACLDGNFNYDCDEHFGECADRNDLGNIDEADLYAEVWIGRAPVDSKEELSNFVMKTLRYEQTSDSYLEDILFVGEDLGFPGISRWGGNFKDPIGDFVPNSYNLRKFYDRDLPEEWYPSDIIDLIQNDPPHLINHDGHGNHNYILKMSDSYLRSLENEKPFFIYSHSCLTGSFDNYNCWSGYQENDCIAEVLTCEMQYGAFACILNARYGLGAENSIESPSGAYDESFFKALFNENIRELGAANHWSKQDNIWRIDENGMRWCYYQTNLFGDPELMIKNPNVTQPNKPKISGPNNGMAGKEYSYSAISSNPQMDELYYWFDWGDNTNSGWIGPCLNDVECNANHAWTEKGNYELRVKVKNSFGVQSEWSDPLPIIMPRDRLYVNNFFWNILEKFIGMNFSFGFFKYFIFY